MKKFTVYLDVGKVDALVSTYDGADEDDVREQVREFLHAMKTRYGINWRLMRIEVQA